MPCSLLLRGVAAFNAGRFFEAHENMGSRLE